MELNSGQWVETVHLYRNSTLDKWQNMCAATYRVFGQYMYSV